MPSQVETRDEIIARWEHEGIIVKDCLGCKEFYDASNPFNVNAPRHKASSNCESGKRPHCTCDACW